MLNRRNILSVVLFCMTVATWSQSEQPTISPSAVFVAYDGKEEEGTKFDGPAPVEGRFTANPENDSGWNSTYEWRFTLQGEETPYLTRYEQDTNYTFNQAGTHSIVLYAIFTQAGDTVKYTDEYWADATPLTVTVSESKLEMPNAFSPNGDDINDVYKAKEWQSIIEFKATIFNRWGQKIYSWDNPDGGWDGKFNGSDVKQGVYFVNVEAKGADGRIYHIRRDVNLLRGYTENSNSTTEE